MDTPQAPERFRYHADGTKPPGGAIFVFGSNLAGRHGKGAALAARLEYGARYGQGIGRQGQSYAIPTKGHQLEVLPLEVVRTHVEEFLQYARAHPDLSFFVTRVGCGLAKNDNPRVAPLFSAAPKNCSFADEWRPHLEPAPAAAPRRMRPL